MISNIFWQVVAKQTNKQTNGRENAKQHLNLFIY